MAPRPGGLVSRASGALAPKFIRKSSRKKDAEVLFSETNAEPVGAPKGVASTSSANIKYFGRHWKNKTVPSGNMAKDAKDKVKNGGSTKKNPNAQDTRIKGKAQFGEHSQSSLRLNNSTNKSKSNIKRHTPKLDSQKHRVPLTEGKRQAARRNWKRVGKRVIESLGPPKKKSKAARAGKNPGPKLLERLSKPPPEITEREMWLMSKIPGVPVWVAAICFVCNFLVPGLGTMVSAWSLLCCGYTRRDYNSAEIMNLICINMWIALCQVMTVTFCLVGWFWSVFWGIKLIQKATVLERQRTLHDAELRDMTTKAFRDNMLRLVDTTRIV